MTTRRHEETGVLVFTCPRCGTELNPDGRPVESHDVAYVEAGTERNPYQKEVAVALRHTDSTRTHRDETATHNELETEPANNVLARRDENYPHPDGDPHPDLAAYEEVVGVDPEEEKANPDTVKVTGREIEVDMPAYLLVDRGCLEADDTIVWEGTPPAEVTS